MHIMNHETMTVIIRRVAKRLRMLGDDDDTIKISGLSFSSTEWPAPDFALLFSVHVKEWLKENGLHVAFPSCGGTRYINTWLLICMVYDSVLMAPGVHQRLLPAPTEWEKRKIDLIAESREAALAAIRCEASDQVGEEL
jgi:hypothetical protein